MTKRKTTATEIPIEEDLSGEHDIERMQGNLEPEKGNDPPDAPPEGWPVELHHGLPKRRK